MLKSEGYKMFRGMATIHNAKTGALIAEEVGDWLYRPEWDTWYVNGRSYPAKCVSILHDETEEPEVETILYEEVATYHNCSVQILKNALTGQESIGWWRNDE